MLARQQLRKCTWLALYVMLGLALAPTVSRALSVVAHHVPCDAHDKAPADESVSSSEPAPATLHAAHDLPANGAAAEHDHLNHCPMCGVAATAWTVSPPAPAWAAAAQAVAQPTPSGAQEIHRGSAVWRAHPPRGPPVAI